MLTSRQQSILKHLIETYIREAEPVGSTALTDVSELAVSSATIRNELAVLEELGYIMQPHTSAGRVPTEKAYQYFVEQYVRGGTRDALTKRLREEMASLPERELALKQFARSLSEVSGLLILVGFDRQWNYYTGVSALLEQKEFQNPIFFKTLSLFIDQCDEVTEKIYDTIPFEPTIAIGSLNPFGGALSSILFRQQKDGPFFGMIGPMRMDYQTHLTTMCSAKEALTLSSLYE